MRFTVKAKELLAGLKILSGLVPPPRSMVQPQSAGWWQNILVDAAVGDDTLDLIATTGPVLASYKVNATVSEYGQIFVPLHLLYKVVRNMATSQDITVESTYDSVVSLEQEDNRCSIWGASVDKVAVDSIKSYRFGDGQYLALTLQSDVGLKVQKTVGFAMSKKGYVSSDMLGILLAKNGMELTAVATDGYRMAAHRFRLVDCNWPDDSSVVVCREVFDVLSRVASGSSNGQVAVRIDLEQDRIEFRYGSLEVVAYSISQTFANYKAVLQMPRVLTICVPKNEFVAALKQCLTFDPDVSLRKVVTQEDQRQSRIIVSADNSKLGQVSYAVKTAFVYDGSDFPDVCLNGKWLLEAVCAIEGEYVVLEFCGDGRPLIIRSSIENGVEQIHAVMPLEYSVVH